MFKSLFSGVSGLAANLTNLDVIGNNIANSNTTGFKSGRVTFNEMLTQTIKSASRPVAGGLGGTNPQQIGLGTSVGSIDTNFAQGNFQTTGKKTDLAIQGPGFFVLSDGNSRSYTRAGIFGLDSENVLVNPSTGLRVQGLMADANGVLASGPMSDIFIDPGLVVPASPSTTVSLMGNLDSASDAKGTVMESPSFLVAATGADILTEMSGETDGDLGLNVGDVININGRVGGSPITAAGVTVTEGMTLDEMLTLVEAELAAVGVSMALAVDPLTGAINATPSGTGGVDGFSMTVNGKTQFNTNFAFPSTLADGTAGSSKALRAYATADDLLVDMYDSNGTSLGLNAGPTTLSVGGSVGGSQLPPATLAVDATTTLGELAQALQFSLNINSNPVEINDEGQIAVRGEVGTSTAIGDISISEDGAINSALEKAFAFTQTQQAADQKTFSMATTVFDSLGGEHTISFSFEKVPGANEWIWEAEMEGGESIQSGASGRARFNESGSISAFTFDDGSGSLTFVPQAAGAEGAANVNLTIDYGEIGALTGLTQFEGSGNLQSIADGFGTGTLVDFSIDQAGIITGIFSNDTAQTIARIGMATFSNADGLTRDANNTYRRSGNSGQAIEMFAGAGNGISLVPGALETSNVDLAKEFTNLVVAQRSFQANSRVITTADQVMQELVNLVR